MTDATRVAFQGEPGAFSEEAVARLLRRWREARPVPTWRAVFEAVASAARRRRRRRDRELAGGLDPRDVRPARRSSTTPASGSSARSASRSGSRSSRCPASRSTGSSASTATPRRWPRPTSSCAAADWQVMTTYNTAGAARMIAEQRERGAAAIASPRVAALYGLEVLADNVQTGDENRTRFAVLARERAAPMALAPTSPAGPRKTTLVFAVRNVPGLAPSLPRRVRDPRRQPVAPRVAPGPDGPLGVRLLGRHRRRRRRPDVRRRDRRPARRGPDGPGPRHVREAGGELTRRRLRLPSPIRPGSRASAQDRAGPQSRAVGAVPGGRRGHGSPSIPALARPAKPACSPPASQGSVDRRGAGARLPGGQHGLPAVCRRPSAQELLQQPRHVAEVLVPDDVRVVRGVVDLDRDEVGLAQDREVVEERRPGDAHPLGEVRRRRRRRRQLAQDPQPRLVADRLAQRDEAGGRRRRPPSASPPGRRRRSPRGGR